MEAARDSTTHSSICTAAQSTATGNSDHGTLSAHGPPSSTIMFATGRYPISEVTSSPAAASAAGCGSSANRCGSTVSSTPNATSGVSTQPTSCSVEAR